MQVVLPTFILEKRSLLEMYADFMAHPDLLLAITAGATPEERVISFVEYYLTAFHEGRKGTLAKKPYNPIIGETFHCSWEVPKDRVKSKRTSPHSPVSCHEHPLADDPGKSYKLRFVAEQVSHHPPVSCFYCECKEKRLCVNTHVWTKSKFMGMSVGVSMIGEGKPSSLIGVLLVLFAFEMSNGCFVHTFVHLLMGVGGWERGMDVGPARLISQCPK